MGQQAPLPTLHPGLFLRSLGARGAGGTLQGGLGQASGEGSERRVCHGGRGEEFVPAGDGGTQVQLIQHDLGHAHEALVVHAAVVSPDDYLPVGKRTEAEPPPRLQAGQWAQEPTNFARAQMGQRKPNLD